MISITYYKIDFCGKYVKNMSSIYLTVHCGAEVYVPLAKKDCIALIWAPLNDQYTDGGV